MGLRHTTKGSILLYCCLIPLSPAQFQSQEDSWKSANTKWQIFSGFDDWLWRSLTWTLLLTRWSHLLWKSVLWEACRWVLAWQHSPFKFQFVDFFFTLLTLGFCVTSFNHKNNSAFYLLAKEILVLCFKKGWCLCTAQSQQLLGSKEPQGSPPGSMKSQ